jgi:hypothetical protein
VKLRSVDDLKLCIDQLLTRVELSFARGAEQMNRKRVLGIVLLVGAIVVLAGGAFTLVAGHTKSGIGLFVLGIIVVGVGLFSIISSFLGERVQLDTDWR